VCMLDTKYHVTGVTKLGHRFKLVYSDFITAMCINLWKGSVWEVKNGKRKLIKRVMN